MKEKIRAAFIAWRFYAIIIVALIVIIGLIVRAVDLAVIKRHFLQTEGDERSVRMLSSPALRGMILDRNGSPLAISAAVFSVWVDPMLFQSSPSSIKKIAILLGVAPVELNRALQQSEAKTREFLYLKRGVSPDIAAKLKKLAVPGLYLQPEYKRFYPEGEIMAHVVGFTNADDQGSEGLEFAYNSWLTGVAGKKVVIKDRMGRVMAMVRNIKSEVPGQDVTLSIDKRIQYIAYRELLQGVKKNLAASGSIVVLDAKTGEVLAMVNQPSFNPNNRSGQPIENFRNRAVTDILEPGSTVKAFSVAVALQSGKYKPESVIDTHPGWIRIGHNILHDEHNKGELTITQILEYSSNVGIAKMMLPLPAEPLWLLLHRLGFGETTEIGFPGERAGSLPNRSEWQPFILATMSIGYGFSTTALQLAHAYLTLANHGVKLPVSLLKLDKPPVGVPVMDANIADTVLNMLESVFKKGGTGEYANVPGYHVAGKSGTAKLVGEHGYEKHRYSSLFIGVAPVANPRVIVAVVIRDPRGKVYYGGLVSGPVFAKVMAESLRILAVPPDDTESLPKVK